MNQSTFILYAAKMRLTAERSAMRVGCTVEDARDVASEVMVTMWSIHSRLNCEKCVGYAAVAARNKALNMLRDKKYEHVEIDTLSIGIPEEPSAEQMIISAQEEKWLLDEIKNLPSTQQTILALRRDQMLETPEIAEMLGITPASVATLLSRARRSLFNAIKNRRKNDE